MSSLNRMCIIGNVGRDPEVRRTNNGDPVVNFSVAVTEAWKDKNTGEKREKTQWFNVVVWNEGLCRVCENYVKKGSKIYIDGKMQSRDYTDKDGNQRQAWELVVDRFGGTLVLLGDGGQQRAGDDRGGQETPREPARGGKIVDDYGDAIPFNLEWR